MLTWIKDESIAAVTIKRMLKMLAFVGMLLAASMAHGDSRTRAIMQEVAESLEILLPLSLDSDRFLSAENRHVVLKQFSRLEDSAEALAEHGAARSMDFQLMASGFSRAAGRMRRDLDYLHPADARFLLIDLTQHCLACHSGRSADRDFPLSNALAEYLEEQPLNEKEKARLQVALRQFGGAMESWERILSESATEPVDMALEGDFVEYLTLAVRVREEFSRAARLLENVAAREDVPFYLRRRLNNWIADLEAAEQRKEHALTLSQARRMFHRNGNGYGLPWDDANLVSDLVLSASLRTMAASGSEALSPEQLAEVYYMLGVLEARSLGLYPALPGMERFYESAIRTAPHSPVAVEAYALLEESATTTFSGELPFERTDEIFHRLAELREMIGLQEGE